jgi:HipA-like protein
MGRQAEVYVNDTVAGILEKVSSELFVFRYEESYYNNPKCSAISLTMPKTHREYQSKFLFPFFYGLLSEDDNKELQCRLLRIDPNDHFSHLLATAHTDTIGAVTVREIK